MTVPMMRRAGASMEVATALANPLTLAIVAPAVVVTLLLPGHVAAASGLVGAVDVRTASAVLAGAMTVIIALRRRPPRTRNVSTPRATSSCSSRRARSSRSADAVVGPFTGLRRTSRRDRTQLCPSVSHRWSADSRDGGALSGRPPGGGCFASALLSGAGRPWHRRGANWCTTTWPGTALDWPDPSANSPMNPAIGGLLVQIRTLGDGFKSHRYRQRKEPQIPVTTGIWGFFASPRQLPR